MLLKRKRILLRLSARRFSYRDLSEGKIKNALGMTIQLPKFKGYDSVMDIYTFKTQFEKCVEPYVQRKLLPDTLKLNYLNDPALTLGRKVTDIVEIWKRLMSYENSRMLLQNKLSAFEKLGSLNKVRGDKASSCDFRAKVVMKPNFMIKKYFLEKTFLLPNMKI